ncbi:MAG: aspartate--tRNA(Asn) ligase [Patescibacteria group bacterium]|nr:aspartate--tRNA(Asn) ligase [Patescibacteria group bacterium]
MERTLAIETPQKIGQEITLQGWVNTRRDHGKIIFIDLRDRTGLVQVVFVDAKDAKDLRPEWVVEIKGLVKERPEKLINPKLPTGKVEVEAKEIKVLAKAKELPFDTGTEDLNIGLPVLLDYRALTLKHPRIQAIFKAQEAIAEGFHQAAKEIGCTEVFAPTISASSTEGGAQVFRFNYFNCEAFMVQSPQLYKQIMVGIFEKVFLFSHIYRAEPSVTTRHLCESIQMDCEIGFVDFDELVFLLGKTFAKTIAYAQKKCTKELEFLGVAPSLVEGKIPRLTMREAQQIIFERTGIDHQQEKDLMPEDEKEISLWAREKYNSDLIVITHFPTKKRAFYTMPDPENPEYSLSYDLLYKGLEISSGSQRIHEYNELVAVIKERGMNPENFKMYLQAFEYGMPPHGGFSYGLERSTMKLLDLENIREASLFPRDMERIDFRLPKKEA